MLKYFFLIAIIVVVSNINSTPSLAAVDNTPKTGSANPEEPNLEAIKKSNAAKHQEANAYTISRERDNLACLKPLTIAGLDTLYIINKNGENVYAIRIIGFEGTCKWERDRLLFTKETDVKYATVQMEKFKGNMYLTSSLKLLFSIEKLKDDNSIPIKKLQVPYFIVLHDKKTDKIIQTKNLTLYVKLSKLKKYTAVGRTVEFALTIPEKEVLNQELLSGIYLQNKVNN